LVEGKTTDSNSDSGGIKVEKPTRECFIGPEAVTSFGKNKGTEQTAM
jgi:hypothetical protein